MTYSRENPSPRYRELLGFYQQMHAEGDAAHEIPADEMFDGRNLIPHAMFLNELFRKMGIRTVLDYGSGKGMAYTRTAFKLPDGSQVQGVKAYWGVDEIVLYDPGNDPDAVLPDRVFDAVICTDVMEHIPEQDLDWVIDELFTHARRLVFASISTWPALKLFPDGTNVHVTLKDVDWWRQRFFARKAATGSTAEFALFVYKSAKDPEPVLLTSRDKPAA
ncbi:hypothetical protein [Ferrovibrio sp.]|uniref:hypothetical protein n=1 Tax=Ferrovibrio sp. TaxID=1917215 RepID=UPI00311FFBA4